MEVSWQMALFWLIYRLENIETGTITDTIVEVQFCWKASSDRLGRQEKPSLKCHFPEPPLIFKIILFKNGISPCESFVAMSALVRTL